MKLSRPTEFARRPLAIECPGMPHAIHVFIEEPRVSWLTAVERVVGRDVGECQGDPAPDRLHIMTVEKRDRVGAAQFVAVHQGHDQRVGARPLSRNRRRVGDASIAMSPWRQIDWLQFCRWIRRVEYESWCVWYCHVWGLNKAASLRICARPSFPIECA